MKPRRTRRAQRSARSTHSATLEILEPRTLLSLTIGGITIPGLPSIPGLSSLLGGITLPNFTNKLFGSLSSFSNPNPNDYWWLHNTGQTLSQHPSGPATGTPGADINAQNAWNISTGSSNVVVAVLDTGIDLNNADLASALWTNPGNLKGDTYVNDTHGWNFLNNNNNLQDNFVHGTAVAAAIHSVAPGISILPVEVGTATGVNDQALVNGINYLIMLKKAGVNIVAINASYISFTPPTSAEISAIKSAGDNGMLYVAAAGNGSLNLDSLIPDIPSYLAKYIPQFLPSNLIFVAATDNQDHLASFSDYGAYTVAVGAPGVDMTLPIPGGLYASLSGTSFAAPMVSGIAGLLKSEFPAATLSQLKSAILNSGDPNPALAGKTTTGRRVDAFKALLYMMGDKAPTGAVEVLNNTTISGWAFDPNLGSDPATVKITMDGTTIATLTADAPCSDLPASIKSTDHGFSFDTSATPYGKHAIKVYAVDDITSKLTLIGSGKLIVDTAPSGAVELAATKTVTGYAFDSDTPAKSIQVKLFLDGKSWMTTTASIARPDLAGTFPSADLSVKHGFQFNLGILNAGIHRIDAYAVDSLTGSLTLIGTNTISANRPATGAVETLTASTLSGWAFDPDAGSSAIQIQYQIDNFAPVCLTANLARSDLKSNLGSPNHGFNIALPQLTAGDHTITVNAIDPNNKLLVLLASQTLTVADPTANPLPSGAITISNHQVTGTVTDGTSCGPIPIQIIIDNGKSKPTTYTTTATLDAGSGNFIFSYTLPTLTGIRRVDVFALDDQTATPTLLARQFINYSAPTATVDSFTAIGTSGYALAPNGTGGIAQLRIDIDDLTGNLVCANLQRPDLKPTLGRSNVGFNIPMPKLAPGTHIATLYLIDPITLAATSLGQITFTTV